MAERQNLTDRGLRALAKKPAAPGRTYEIYDSVVPGLAVRISETARRTFIVVGRFGGAKHPTRRALGTYGEMTLDHAREKARRWIEMAERGSDPKHVEKREREAVVRTQANTFAAVAEAFIDEKVKTERRGREVERNIRREMVTRWGDCPIVDITDEDVLAAVEEKKATAPAQARNLLGDAKRLFSWATAPGRRSRFGLKTSPCADLKPTEVLGEKKVGDRTLSEDELFALWRAATRMPYPYGAAYRLLVLTALRLNEVADASWREFDIHRGLWEIPAERMKGKEGRAKAHLVPLTDEIKAVLDTLPRFKHGDFVFSTSFGVKPVWMSDKVKKRLDRRMLRTLRALAHRRGDDPARVALAPWANHDIRRTVRSHLSRLKIAEESREAVLAHVRPGIKRTYDKHDYLDEKCEALSLWAARLRSIVEPAPANVVELKAAGR